MMKPKKTILVTGGAGFIGSNFVRYILEKYTDYHVMVLDNLTYAGNPENFDNGIINSPCFSFWYGNVRNPEIVNELVAKADVVVHMAAETHVARSIYDNAIFFETDVLGTQVIANAVAKHPNVERFIHISTSEVYGTALTEPMTEEHPLNPTTPYASAKAGADRLVYSYYVTYGIPAIIVRPFNNYGPYQHLEKVIPRFITSALLDEPLTIHGDGKSSRDWLYVEDHCEALDKLIHVDLDKVKGQVINIGTGRDVNIETIAYMVLEMLGKSKALITYVGERPGQVRRHIASTEKAKKLLGWEAKTSFEEGLEKTIKWYQNHRNWWQKLLWMRTVPIKKPDGTIEWH
ncbi:MAG: epimerase [Candidatus Aenigmatarchaeota archaeon]|nr:MAG: epimerase [Candidatus Aenigmarchaeota archaeon]